MVVSPFGLIVDGLLKWNRRHLARGFLHDGETCLRRKETRVHRGENGVRDGENAVLRGNDRVHDGNECSDDADKIRLSRSREGQGLR